MPRSRRSRLCFLSRFPASLRGFNLQVRQRNAGLDLALAFDLDKGGDGYAEDGSKRVQRAERHLPRTGLDLLVVVQREASACDVFLGHPRGPAGLSDVADDGLEELLVGNQVGCQR